MIITILDKLVSNAMEISSMIHQDKKTRLNTIKEKADNAPDTNFHFVEYIKECSKEQQPILSNHLCKHQNILDVPQFNSNVTLEPQLKERNLNKVMILTILDKLVSNAMKVSSTVHQDKKTRFYETKSIPEFNNVNHDERTRLTELREPSENTSVTENNKLVCSSQTQSSMKVDDKTRNTLKANNAQQIIQ